MECPLTGHARFRSTSDTRDNVADAGSSNISNADKASITSPAVHTTPARTEALVTKHSTVHATDTVTLSVAEEAIVEPIVSPQLAVDQDERVQDDITLSAQARQEQEDSAVNKHHHSEQPDEDSDDLDDVQLLVQGTLAILCDQISEKYPQCTVEHLKDRIASFANPKTDHSPSERGIRQSDQGLRPTPTGNHTGTDVSSKRHTPSPVAHAPDSQIGVRRSITLPSIEAARIIQGNMRFTNCGQVNIAPTSLNRMADHLQTVGHNTHQQYSMVK